MSALTWSGEVTADANGIVMYDPELLIQHYAGVEEGRNLLREYLTTGEGDRVLKEGLIVPVLAIDADTYTVHVEIADDGIPDLEEVVRENGDYALRVKHGLVVADIAQLMEWYDQYRDKGFRVPVPAGTYAVRVFGFRVMSADGSEILDAGYRFRLRREDSLPPVTADTGAPMRVLDAFERPWGMT